MAADDPIKRQLEALIAEAPALLDWDENEKPRPLANPDHRGCHGWMIAAQHVVETACPRPDAAYRKRFDAFIEEWRRATHQSHGSDSAFDYFAPLAVQRTRELLKRLLADINAGLLVNIANRAVAETFDTFLDHGTEYLKIGSKNEAGVIAGVVFEDTIRKICRMHDISENGVKLDELVSALVKRELLTGLKAKRARAAAGLRTSAAHARWEEFDEGDVRPVIELTRELLEAHLDKPT
jgi:hypothetical protein